MTTPADVTQPVMTRYEVQTRSGLSWGWYSGGVDLSIAFASARAARRTGYSVRVLDTRSGATIQIPR